MTLFQIERSFVRITDKTGAQLSEVETTEKKKGERLPIIRALFVSRCAYGEEAYKEKNPMH